MISIVDSHQVPPPASGGALSIPSLPLADLKPGQAVRIPFEMLPGDSQSISKAFDVIRTRVCRARKSMGLNLQVQKSTDAFYVTRVA